MIQQHDRAGYKCDQVESRIFMLHTSHDHALMSEILCDLHVTSKIEQESWFV
jgi:hypothetical protein